MEIRKKGQSEWIWIVISVILGLITIVVGATLLLSQADATAKNSVLQQFSVLQSEMSRICLKGGIGQTTYLSDSVPNSVRAIYVANSSDESPPDLVSDYITKGRSGIGTYLCIQFFDENIPRCQAIPCDMIFTYIGTPSQKQTLQIILSTLSGNTPTYNFYMFLNKTDYHLVRTVAVPLIGNNLPNMTTNSAGVP